MDCVRKGRACQGSVVRPKVRIRCELRDLKGGVWCVLSDGPGGPGPLPLVPCLDFMVEHQNHCRRRGEQKAIDHRALPVRVLIQETRRSEIQSDRPQSGAFLLFRTFADATTGALTTHL